MYHISTHESRRILDGSIKSQVVAQPEAVESISSAVRCLLSGLTDPSRPVASFVLGGPSGSGQVLLAKEVRVEGRLYIGLSRVIFTYNLTYVSFSLQGRFSVQLRSSSVYMASTTPTRTRSHAW